MARFGLDAVVRSAHAKRAVFRLFYLALLAVAGVAACKAAQSPAPKNGETAHTAAPDGGVALATPPTHPLFEEEKPTGKLVAFRDDQDLASFREAWRAQEEEKIRDRNQRPVWKMPGNPDAGPGNGPMGGSFAPAEPSPEPKPAKRAAPARPAPTAAAPAAAESRAAEKADKSASKDKGGAESITNNQHADVDEGDIVKLHGDHLVVLRRGRIFTISLAGDKIRQSKMLDAFGPEIDPRGSWYDEMVVDGDNVVVVGFSYQRGGTEIGLFKIDKEGGLTYRATYHLRSNDYYSARNYASRIVDGRLIFYSPLYVSSHETDLSRRFPAVRRWQKNVADTDFVRTLAAPRLYHIEGELPSSSSAALHTVTSCDLREPTFKCESTGVIGPPGRVFYVSPSAVYVWMQDFARRNESERPQPNGLLAKLPIGRTKDTVSAVRVAGMPTDQFSFEEDDTGHLDVLVRAQANGDAMFLSETTAGAAALLRIPQNLFSDGVPVASAKRYRTLPRPDGFAVQNRFVGSWLLYGSGRGYVRQHSGRGQLYAVRYTAAEDPVSTIDLDQGIDRIEAMGDDAVIVGSRDADLVFTPIELGNKEAHARRDYVRKNAAQGEMRSHGFFYKPAPGATREGVIGLPIRIDRARGAQYLLEGSAAVLFLSHKSLEFNELGALAASTLATNHDGCRASCVDWYGNARPIFAKGRIFALMGYELVEGKIEDKGKAARIQERTRLSFAPKGGAPLVMDDDGF